MSPLVTIIIPVYNVEQYLDECIASVEAQSYHNLEIILVNDGSTDRSLDICKTWAEKDLRIKIISTDNQGLSHARNTGVSHSNGELIGFIDSDDFVDSCYVEKLVSILENNPDCSISTCCAQMFIDGKSVPFGIGSWQFNGIRYIQPNEWAERMMLMKSLHSACGKLYKRDLVNFVHFRNGFLNEDILFCFDLIPYIEGHDIRTVEISDVMYNYRIRPDSICHGRKIEMIAAENRNMKIFMAGTKEKRPVIYEYYYKEYLVNTILLLNEFLNGAKFNISVAELRTDLKGYSDAFVKNEVADIQYNRYLCYKYLFPVAYVLYRIRRMIK